MGEKLVQFGKKLVPFGEKLYMQPLGPYSWTLCGDFILESIKDRIADVTTQRLEGARTINN